MNDSSAISHAEHVLMQIANGQDPDFAALPATAQGDEPALRLLADVSRAFRATAHARAREEPLFTWRHLKVMERLGSGGFGEVYRASDPTLQRDVALKLAHARHDAVIDPHLVMAEARHLARLRHPNILAVHGAGTDQGRVGIWCDLVPGQTLEALLASNGPLTARQMLDIVLPLSAALTHLHQRGMVHGDLKPDNIMIQPNGEPVLMDFGAARLLGSATLTQGSPLYMAPETLAGAAATSAADVHALGVTCYRLFSNEFPFPADDVEALQAQHASEDRPPLNAIPRPFRTLLRTMLARRPERRPPMADVHAQLRRIETRPQRLFRRTMIGAVVGILAAATIISTLAYRTAAKSRDRLEVVKDTLVEAAAAVSPTRQSGPTTVLAMYQYLAEAIEEKLIDYPEALAEMRITAGANMSRLGETDQGLAVAERGLELMQEVFADDPAKLTSAFLEVGGLRRLNEDLAGAEQALRDALAQIEKRDADEAMPDWLIAQNRLALLLGSQGRWHEEVEVGRRLLKARQEHYGEDSIRTAVDHHNLAGALHTIGDIDGARRHELRALELLRADGDENSMRLGFVLFMLSKMELDAGNLEQTEELLAQVRAIYEASLPEGHRNRYFLAEGFAQLQLAKGEVDGAITAFRDLLELEGAEYAQTRFTAARGLALALMQRGEWAEAHAIWRTSRTERPDIMRPLDPVLDAALTYTGHRANLGPTAEEARLAITMAQDVLTAQRLTGRREYAWLGEWQDALSSR